MTLHPAFLLRFSCGLPGLLLQTRETMHLQKIRDAVYDRFIPFSMQHLKRTSLVTQIIIGLIAGIALALFAPEAAKSTAFIGKVFVRR
jgi:hypothetical protein